MKDKIKNLISLMEELAGKQEYESAQKVLDSIKEELTKQEDLSKKYGKDWNPFVKTEPTIRNTYDVITGYSIRLNPDFYKFSDLLGLLSQVTERLKTIKRADDYTVRKIVAEELVCNNMIIPKTYKGKKPNRAFLDVAYKVNPDLCKLELERREKVKLWKAIESGKKEEIKKASKEVRKYRE